MDAAVGLGHVAVDVPGHLEVAVAVHDFAGLGCGCPGEVTVVWFVAGHEDETLDEVEEIAVVLCRIDREAQEVCVAARDGDGDESHIFGGLMILEELRIEVAVLLPDERTLLELRNQSLDPAGEGRLVGVRDFVAACQNVIRPDHRQQSAGDEHAFVGRGLVVLGEHGAGLRLGCRPDSDDPARGVRILFIARDPPREGEIAGSLGLWEQGIVKGEGIVAGIRFKFWEPGDGRVGAGLQSVPRGLPRFLAGKRAGAHGVEPGFVEQQPRVRAEVVRHIDSLGDRGGGRSRRLRSRGEPLLLGENMPVGQQDRTECVAPVGRPVHDPEEVAQRLAVGIAGQTQFEGGGTVPGFAKTVGLSFIKTVFEAGVLESIKVGIILERKPQSFPAGGLIIPEVKAEMASDFGDLRH